MPKRPDSLAELLFLLLEISLFLCCTSFYSLFLLPVPECIFLKLFFFQKLGASFFDFDKHMLHTQLPVSLLHFHVFTFHIHLIFIKDHIPSLHLMFNFGLLLILSIYIASKILKIFYYIKIKLFYYYFSPLVSVSLFRILIKLVWFISSFLFLA